MPNPTHTDKTSAPASAPSIRSLLILIGGAAGIGVALALAISVLRVARTVQWRPILLGLDGMRVPLAVLACALVALGAGALWWRPRWRTVACGGLLMAALAAVGGCLLRVESFYGNLIPRLAWRWTPTAEEQFASWQTSGQHATAPTAQHVTPETAAVTADRDHPGFLGAERDGVVRGVQLDADWAHRPPRELWRRPVGLGWSGFAVAGRLAVTQEQRGPQESVVGYDLLTGAERWIHVDDVRFADEHGDGPRATPALVGGRVFTLGGTGLLNCLDAQSGQRIWQQQVLAQPDQQNLLWGMSGSPLVVDDRVVVTPGGGPGRAVMAFACRDGQPVWSRGDDPAAYASPAVVQLAGQTQLLSFNGAGVRGFALADGQPLWLCPWITQGERQRVNVAQPLVVTFADAAASRDEGLILVSSGYEMGTALLRVSQQQGNWQVAELWHSRQLKSKMSNFVVRDGYIYGFDSGILTCLDLRDGQRMWKRGRYGHGQLLLVADLLLIQAETGEVLLVEATAEEHRELASLAALDGKTWNHAALAGNVLVVRNDREAAAYELPEKQSSVPPSLAQSVPAAATTPQPR